MILARILAPSVFGIIATINMIVSFTDMFTTAGLQKYLIQHNYKNKSKLYEGATIAFWTNLFFSLIFWGIIVIYKDSLAIAVGSKGHGLAIAVACFSLPITSFSSIQEALFSRDLNYKILFYNRIIAILLPFFITIPLALLGFGYWSLIIGTITGNLAKAITLTLCSEWKPNFYFNLRLLKQMIKFGVWSLLESLALWASSWIDVFIISNKLGGFYTGVYKNCQSTVTGILSIITSATTGVLFSSLSRSQNDHDSFVKLFDTFQQNISIFVLPMGIGIFIFKDLITYILLGEKWMIGSDFIGIWGLCTSLVAVYGTFCREVYRAKGMPKLSLFVQFLHLVFVVPLCIWGVSKGFNTLIYVRSFSYLQIIFIHMFFMYKYFRISPKNYINNTAWPLVCSIVMGLFKVFF